MSGPVDIDAMEARIQAAELECAAQVAEAIFGPFQKPPPGGWPAPPPMPWTARLSWRWCAFREWLAVHVLRVDIHQGSDDE